MDINLNGEFNKIIKSIDTHNKPNLFLHVCCAPCSSATLEKLYNYFNIYILFYNPNIDTSSEYTKRYNELIKLLAIKKYDISIIYENYDHDTFLNYIKGYENLPEGDKRCELCFKLRLKTTLDYAINYINSNNLSDTVNYLCTTLSISPHKNAKLIYDIGINLCKDTIVRYLPSDFKKEDGYLNSIKLSKKYNLYRQDYCGCEFSKHA